MSTEKSALRKHVLSTLRSLPMEVILEKSKRIEARLLESPFWRNSTVVYCYVSLPREVQTIDIRRRAFSDSKQLALPRVVGEEIRFHQVDNPEQPLVRSALNIDEPPEDLPPVAPAAAEPDPGIGAAGRCETGPKGDDRPATGRGYPAAGRRDTGTAADTAGARTLVLVPGLAFDGDRFRLGRGRGYYDRFLARYRGMVRAVGLCFEEQLVERVPRQEWDMPLDAIITDKRMLSG